MIALTILCIALLTFAMVGAVWGWVYFAEWMKLDLRYWVESETEAPSVEMEKPAEVAAEAA
ncbi:MAG: hypothetical protein D6765_07885 [Bacteroidetes bacterium]|nr:MAG: hypothetical protein D6765_07885 [Bacteroidota bacterium]